MTCKAAVTTCHGPQQTASGTSTESVENHGATQVAVGCLGDVVQQR